MHTEYRANVALWSDAEPFLWAWYSFFPVHIQAIQMQQQEVLVAIQSAGYINRCMHGTKPVVRTAHTTFPWALHWGRLMCTLPDGASPGQRDSWAHPELHYCLGSELLGTPKATVEAVGPRQYLHFPHYQVMAQSVVRSQLATLVSPCCCRSSERRELQPPRE